jgi:hypothetical protein
MLYASTVATLKREFGLTFITQEIRATSKVNSECAKIDIPLRKVYGSKTYYKPFCSVARNFQVVDNCPAELF